MRKALELHRKDGQRVDKSLVKHKRINEGQKTLHSAVHRGANKAVE